MKVVIYESLDRYLLQDWRKLWKKSQFANLSNSPQWFVAADQTYQYANKKIVALFNEKKHLIGVCGLVQEKIAGILVWTVAAREFSDNESVLIDYTNSKATKLFFSALSDLGVVYLTNYQNNTVRYISHMKNVSVEQLDENLFVDFQQGVPTPIFAKKIKFIEKKMSKHAISWTSEADVKDKHYGLSQAFAIELASSKLQNGKSVFDTAINRTFYTNLVRIAPQDIVISLVWFNQKAIAYSICFVNNGILQGSQKAHDAQFSTFSPGKLLIASITNYVQIQKLPYFDLGRGVDDFKKSLATRSEYLYGVFIAKNTLLRWYLVCIYKSRAYFYNKIIKFRTIYSWYRLLTKGAYHG